MKSDKTWLLLANYGDWTFVRSMVAWDLGKKLDGLKWTPDSRSPSCSSTASTSAATRWSQSIKIDKQPGERQQEDRTGHRDRPALEGRRRPGFVGKSGMNYAWKDPDEFKKLDDGDRGSRRV